MMTKEDLKVVFKQGSIIRVPKHYDIKGKLVPAMKIGKGIAEEDLLKMGFSKQELRKLEKHKLLEQHYFRIKYSLRSLYVFLDEEPTLCTEAEQKTA